MHRQSIALFLVAGCLLPGSGAADGHGEKVFRETCSACHVERMSAEATDHATDIVAPPMNLLTTIIRKKTGDDEAEFVAHVVAFTKEPRREDVLAMPQAVDRFGLMPAIETLSPGVTDADITAVARWLFHHYDYRAELQQLQEHEANEAKEAE